MPLNSKSSTVATDEAVAQTLARRLAYLTVGYNLLEAAGSLLAAAWAGSSSLLGFGSDSLMESLSGLIIVWRFWSPPQCDGAAQRRERRAVLLIGLTFFVLAVYVAYESLEKLVEHRPPETSRLGIAVAGLSLVVMPLLYAAKMRIARRLHSASLAADARQTWFCMLLSAALLAGLLLHALAGWWQADPLAGLAIATLMLREGYRAVVTRKTCGCA